MTDEDKLQALLTAAFDLEVGEAIDFPQTMAVEPLIEALKTLLPERTFFLRPGRENPTHLEISRVMYRSPS